MGLVSYNDFYVVEHLFHSPGQIIGNDHNRDIDFKGSFGVIDELDAVRLDVRVPSFDLILPVDLQSRWTDNEQGPLMFIDVSHSQRLDSLTDTHLICKKHSTMFLYTKL